VIGPGTARFAMHCRPPKGFTGSLRVARGWATRRRRSERPDGVDASRLPPARSIARAMLARRDRLMPAARR